MVQKISIGILTGILVGMFITSMFLFENVKIVDLILTKITAASIISGVFCGFFAHYSKSKLQIFVVSIIIGAIIFYIKYLITGHNFDPITMGIFVGAMLGGTFAVVKRITTYMATYKRLKRLR